MKRLGIIALALALFAAACSKTANNTNTSNTTNKNSSAGSNGNAPVTSTPATDSSSPTAVYKMAYEAAKRKDVAAFKAAFSKASLDYLEKAAKEEGKTSDEFLKMLMDDPKDPPPPTFEVRNEQINGDKATLEYKNAKGEWEKVKLVKEGGSWKLDMTDEEGKPSSPNTDTGEDKDEGDTDEHGGH